jgi:hypothetical protein
MATAGATTRVAPTAVFYVLPDGLYIDGSAATFDNGAPQHQTMPKFIRLLATFLLAVATCFRQDTLGIDPGTDDTSSNTPERETALPDTIPDTVKVEPGIRYTSDKEPFRGKDFYSRVKYAREDIVFSPTHKRIEYCYYYDNERECYGTTYQITSDTTLDMDGEVWHYRKLGDTYFTEMYTDHTYIHGFAKAPIPFEPAGLFITTTVDKIDTLWMIDYAADYPSLALHKTKVKGTVYAKDQVDQPPTLLNGDTLKTIYLSYGSCVSLPPYPPEDEVTFVVTSEGRIVNIENWSIEHFFNYCPYPTMNMITHLLQFGKLKPAKRKGRNVDVQWTLKLYWQ